MNWEAVGALGELVGAVAVVATLVYLARQVKTSSRTSAIESRVSNQRSYSEFLGQLIADPKLDEMYKRGRKDFSALTEEERARFTNLALQTYSNISSAYFQYSQGVLDEEGWHEYRAILRYWSGAKGTQDWWESVGQYFFSPTFRSVVESESRTAKFREEKR